jgi:hypothetical protein
MNRHIPGLHHENRSSEDMLEGVFLVRIDRAFYRWHPQRPFFVVRFAILKPKDHQAHSFTGRLYCTPRALWKLNWFLRDFCYDPDLMGRDELDEKALLGLRGIVRVSQTPRFMIDSFMPQKSTTVEPKCRGSAGKTISCSKGSARSSGT